MDPVVAHQVMFDMAWVNDPTAWLGLLTLVVIEIVLGIDNLVFIAILSAKLPSSQRAKARYAGLGGALMIRLLLLTFISYIVSMTKPLFNIGDFPVSGRDIVMMIGGIFLLYKATHELHAKLEGFDEELSASHAAGHAFGMVVLQIMVLDAVFSLDAIITAVGMIDHVFIMMFAVVIAMGIMTLASRAITEFVSQHPTLVILCLGFLLLIGFSLIVESLHFHVPKGYLYAAIGFSIVIEIFNQVARKNTLNLGSGINSMQSREIAANLVLRLLGSNQNQVQTLKEAIVSRTDSTVFNNQEKEMVSRVLQLSSIPVKAVMTARPDLEMIDVSEDNLELKKQALAFSHSRLVAYKEGQKDQPLGYIRRVDILTQGMPTGKDLLPISQKVRQPLYLPETVNILKALEEFRKAKKNIAFIFDEFGNFEGVASLHDIMEEIAGELPDQTEIPEIVRIRPGIFRIEGDAILADIARVTGFKVPVNDQYHTMAGFILDYLQHMPILGEKISLAKWTIEVIKVDGNSIEAVRLTNLATVARTEKANKQWLPPRSLGRGGRHFTLLENRVVAPNNDPLAGKNTGNAQNIAINIANEIKGNLFSLHVVEKYGTEYRQVTERAVRERDSAARPQLEAIPDTSAYDTVFIVFPSWGGTFPMAMATFLENSNLEGKTIIPVCTHGGSRLGRSVNDLHSILRNSNIIDDGLDILGSQAHSKNISNVIKNYLNQVAL